MSKELKCEVCRIHLIDIEKGKVKHGTVALCQKCWSLLKGTKDILSGDKKSIDIPDLLKGLFKG